MKTIRITLYMLFALALLLALTATTAIADIDPGNAPYADTQTHVIPANSTQWYRFDYSGDNSVLTVRLLNGAKERLAFEVYTPEELQLWWDIASIGAGSPQKDDLIWAGRFPLSGTYAIQVINHNAYAVSFAMQFIGKAASFTAPTPAPFLVTSTIAPTIANMDPYRAVSAVAAKAQFVPANSTLWYAFNYAGDHSQAVVTITGANKNHLRVQLHTPTQMLKWWDTVAIGQGNPKSDDLIWSGNSHEGGLWYVEVMNENPYAVGFDANVTGKGIW